MASKDVFGNPVPINEQANAARSNLYSAFTGQGLSEKDAESKVNSLLGSATEEQLGYWSSNQNIPSATDSGSSNTSATNSTSELRDSISSDYKTTMDELEAYRARLKERQDADIADIEKQAAATKAETEETQKKVMGSRSLFLAGTQALGRTISGQSNLEALDASQKAEIQAIEDKKQRLINETRNAYEDKDFAAVKKKLSQLTSLRKEQSDLEIKMENLKIQQAQEERANAEYQLKLEEANTTKAKETASSLASGLVSEDGTIPTDEEVQQIADSYGIDPIYLIKAVNDRKDAVTKLLTQNWKTYYDIAKQVDEGQEIQAPDGTIIKGLKKGDTIQYEADIGGIKYKVSAEKDTGKILWKNEIGKVKGTGSGTSGKTVTWDQAKQLGDLSLYGQPVAEIYKPQETLSFDDWLITMNAQDPENYPLMPSPELYQEYQDYVNTASQSPAEKLEEKLEEKLGSGSQSEQTANDNDRAVEIINANPDAIGDETMEKELINAILQETNLTYAQVKAIIDKQ